MSRQQMVHLPVSLVEYTSPLGSWLVYLFIIKIVVVVGHESYTKETRNTKKKDLDFINRYKDNPNY
ncbi:hypothetical protein BpHYR1_036026 [Brachionus plicatilis]|uniref:Uncharacterized protein n=1 Tax=Brachionus plicatilis TaxID=10195 RepID=A0A3M7QG44_BRAPC|nr:hypothetical protein BpHYR1_036026 [Brachionus plicatilis]